MKPWLETIILGGLALLLLIALLLRDDGPTASGRPLFGAVPASLQVVWSEDQFALLFDSNGDRIADLTYQPVARLRSSEAELIRSTLADLRAVRQVTIDAGNADQRAAYGLDEELTLRSPEHGSYHCSRALDGNAYAWQSDPDQLWLLNADPVSLLRRTQIVLRDPGLGLPTTITELTIDGQRLSREHGRWWLQDGLLLRWARQEAIDDLLAALRGKQARAYPYNLPGQARYHLTIRGRDAVGRQRQIEIADHGPLAGAAGIALLRTDSDAGLQELMAVDGPMPALEQLTPQNLIPADPRRAERIRIGNITLERSGETWRLGSHDDGDPQAIASLLASLASLPGDGQPQPLGSPDPDAALVVDWGAYAWSNPRPISGLDGLTVAQLRQRALLPDLEPSAIVAVVVQPRSGAPRMHERADGRWTGTDHDGLEAFLDRLCASSVTIWDGPANLAADTWTSTITLGLADGSKQTIRLDRSGRVAHLERDLSGMLDRASRSAVLGQ